MTTSTYGDLYSSTLYTSALHASALYASALYVLYTSRCNLVVAVCEWFACTHALSNDYHPTWQSVIQVVVRKSQFMLLHEKLLMFECQHYLHRTISCLTLLVPMRPARALSISRSRQMVCFHPGSDFAETWYSRLQHFLQLFRPTDNHNLSSILRYQGRLARSFSPCSHASIPKAPRAMRASELCLSWAQRWQFSYFPKSKLRIPTSSAAVTNAILQRTCDCRIYN